MILPEKFFFFFSIATGGWVTRRFRRVLAVYSVPGHVEEDGCCEPDDSTVELLSPDHLEHVQENHATQCLGSWINILTLQQDERTAIIDLSLTALHIFSSRLVTVTSIRGCRHDDVTTGSCQDPAWNPARGASTTWWMKKRGCGGHERKQNKKKNPTQKQKRDSIYFCIKDTIFIYLCSCK